MEIIMILGTVSMNWTIYNYWFLLSFNIIIVDLRKDFEIETRFQDLKLKLEIMKDDIRYTYISFTVFYFHVINFVCIICVW